MRLDWTPAEGLPAEISRPGLATALYQAEATMAPVDAKTFAVAMDRLLGFAVAFNIPTNAIADTVKQYREALSDMPGDLLIIAVDRARRSWRWGNRLPMPADLLGAVADELAERRSTLLVLRAAKRKMDRREEDRLEELKRQAALRLSGQFEREHGMSMEDAKRAWRRRQGLAGEATTRAEIIDAIRGAVTVYAPGFGPAPELRDQVKNETEVVAEEPAPEGFRIQGSEPEKYTEGVQENATCEKMAKTVCHHASHLAAIAFAIFASVNPLISLNDLHGTAIALPLAPTMANDGYKDKIREERSSRTQSLNNHRVLYSYRDSQPLPRRVARAKNRIALHTLAPPQFSRAGPTSTTTREEPRAEIRLRP